MIFGNNTEITDLWVREVNFKEGKPQTVAGRPQHSLSLRLGGNVRFEVDGKRYVSAANGITFMPAGTDYRTQIVESGSMMVAHFSTVESTPNARPLFLDNRADLKPLFTELCKANAAGDERYYCSLSLFYELLYMLCKSPHSVPRRIRTAKETMDTRFAEPLTVAALAREAGISDVLFRKEFKQHYGVSPLGYLKAVRIENAKQLLRSGYYTVTDVALECGFESISYFSYEFKRATGDTPTAYVRNTDQ